MKLTPYRIYPWTTCYEQQKSWKFLEPGSQSFNSNPEDVLFNLSREKWAWIRLVALWKENEILVIFMLPIGSLIMLNKEMFIFCIPSLFHCCKEGIQKTLTLLKDLYCLFYYMSIWLDLTSFFVFKVSVLEQAEKSSGLITEEILIKNLRWDSERCHLILG